jgi:hypothetical protein
VISPAVKVIYGVSRPRRVGIAKIAGNSRELAFFWAEGLSGLDSQLAWSFSPYQIETAETSRVPQWEMIGAAYAVRDMRAQQAATILLRRKTST